MDGGAGDIDLRSFLAAVEESSPIDAVEVLSAELVAQLHAHHAGLLIANFSGSGLVRLTHVGPGSKATDGRNERAEHIPLSGTAYERALWSQTVEITECEVGWIVLVPITERGDAIGLLEVALPDKPGDETLDYLVSAAHALAYVLVVGRRYTDLFEWAQRDVPFSIAAEIQRRLLPSAYSAEAGSVTLAGWLEPAHNAGGDSFDYSLDREFLYASLTDAMGHSTDAALLATLAVATLRNQRRRLADPAAQANVANSTLQSHASADQFVTGLLLRIRLSDGRMEMVNAGHPPAYLLRDGQATRFQMAMSPPLGVGSAPYTPVIVNLQPGDRLLMVTDGYLERGAGNLDIERALVASQDRHPRQLVQELARNVLDAVGGQLRDDATTLCLDWYGPAGRRDATGGASTSRATVASPVA